MENIAEGFHVFKVARRRFLAAVEFVEFAIGNLDAHQQVNMFTEDRIDPCALHGVLQTGPAPLTREFYVGHQQRPLGDQSSDKRNLFEGAVPKIIDQGGISLPQVLDQGHQFSGRGNGGGNENARDSLAAREADIFPGESKFLPDGSQGILLEY